MQCADCWQEVALSTWQLAAGGIQSKLLGFKQRTAWRFKTLQDTKTAVVFNGHSSDIQSASTRIASDGEEIHIQPRTQVEQDPCACHNVLERVSSDTLNGILSATSPENTDRFCKTMTGFMIHSCSPLMRKRMLDVLTVQRLDDISLNNRAIIIRAIQRFLLSPLHRERVTLNTAACNILRGTLGKELTILKELVNIGAENDEDQPITTTSSMGEESGGFTATSPFGTFRKRARARARSRAEAHALPLLSSGDLTQLVYGNKNLVEIVQVMQHITKESINVVDETRGLPLVKVVSDIDDTLFAGWLDKRYPLHILYPGVSELYRSLARRSVVNDGALRTTPFITFLTARPRGWLNMGRYLTMQHLQTLGIPKPTVLNGSVRGLGSNTNMAKLKYENFVRYATLFPEFKFVFFGDSGQGDALVAGRLLREFPTQVLGAFIHDVNPTSATTGDGNTKSSYREMGVEFFSSYLEAALICFEKGLITREDLLRVSQSAEQELRNLPFSGRQAMDLRAQRWADFTRIQQQVTDTIKTNPSVSY